MLRAANPQHSSSSNEHYTPPEIIVAATYTLGAIDLDPASHPRVAHMVGAKRYYTERDDGLSQSWHGRVFLNPPGGHGSAKKWWNKLIIEYPRRASAAIYIGFNLEILQTAQSCMLSPLDFPFCIPSKRIQFYNEQLEPGTRPTHANVIVFLPGRPAGPSIFRFQEAFGRIGKCINPIGGRQI